MSAAMGILIVYYGIEGNKVSIRKLLMHLVIEFETLLKVSTKIVGMTCICFACILL